MMLLDLDRVTSYYGKTPILKEIGLGLPEGQCLCVLGRNGVTEVTLIDSLESVDKSMPAFREVLKNFSYKSGESYSEFKSGDKIAEYGLGALVLGGAAAVGYKLGFFATLGVFFKKFFKLIIAGVVAIAAGIKKLFSFGTGSKRSDG